MKHYDSQNRKFSFTKDNRESILDKQEDLSYFESLISKYQEDLNHPLITKRSNFHQEDPIEELQEVY